jgi:hypothetical protein
MIFATLIALAAAAATPTACTRANAESATIRQIMTEPDRFRHRCVTVTALQRGASMFESVDDFYLASPFAGKPEANPIYRGRLILENQRRMRSWLGHADADRLHRATATGEVRDCVEIRDAIQASAGPDEIVFTTGLCHYLHGWYLQTSELEIGEAVPAVRLTGEANRTRVGNLVEAPPSWPYRAFVEEHARRYLAALRAGDRTTFLALHLDAERPQSGGAAGRDALEAGFGRHRGFADLRTSPRSPQMAIFLEDEPGPATTPPGQAPSDYSALICFCRGPDCTARWPISSFDADNREDRPYACTDFSPYFLMGRPQPAFSTAQSNGGLPEPSASSPTR